MAKTVKKRQPGGISKPDPYAGAAVRKAKAGNKIFAFNTKTLGQHILKNPGISQQIVQKSFLKQSDTVLEIGPGSGNLTINILSEAKRAIAIEADPRMAAELTKRFQGTPAAKKLDLVLGDAIKMPFPYFDVCISNTPYQISSPLVMKLLSHAPAPRTCVLMFQLEFSNRLLAKPGDKLYSRLSANVQMFAKVEHIMKVGRGNFNPPPQVESSVVRITMKRPRPAISFDEWDGLLRICFNRPNRVLRSAFLGTKTVLDMIERNYRIFCAQNDILIDDGPSKEIQDALMIDENDDDDDGDMDIDDGDDGIPDFFGREVSKPPSRRPKTKVYELVRAKVVKVLEHDTGLSDKRTRQCEEGDFLRLLEAFNKENIHFS